MANKKLISVATHCYNEEGNVEELYRRVKQAFEKLEKYDYEIIFIDNASLDNTGSIIKKIAANDNRVKAIINTRNFGVVRSSYYVLMQAKGDAVVAIASDLQDPPEVIPDFIKKWEEGYKVVKGIKSFSKESPLMYGVRSFYYFILNILSDVKLSTHFTEFVLCDRKVIDTLREIDDPCPYIRGLIDELGFESAEVEYTQERRKNGKSSNDFYKLYDMAMLGITSHSRIPLRLATMFGFFMSLLSLLTAIGYLIAKLVLWDRFPLGVAPTIISIYFLSSVQLFFIGILGEYIGFMHMRSMKRPLVIEKERINFK